MSAANKRVLSLQEEDLTKILVANAHLGSQNLDFQMCLNAKTTVLLILIVFFF